MYAGFVTTKRVVKQIGIHQRFDMAAHRMIAPYISTSTFPPIKSILHFEGLNGPDGLKLKSPGIDEHSHFYDPIKETGELPHLIASHYESLVEALSSRDLVRAAFDASWLAHFVCDGMTPAHHYPHDEKMIELLGKSPDQAKSWLGKGLATSEGERPLVALRKNWQIWGPKGLHSTHQNFEMGVAFALVLFPIRAALLPPSLSEARRVGPIDFFKSRARAIAELNLYERFYDQGWNADIARTVKARIAPDTAQTIGIIWLLAYLEAGYNEVAALHKAGSQA